MWKEEQKEKKSKQQIRTGRGYRIKKKKDVKGETAKGIDKKITKTMRERREGKRGERRDTQI